MSNPIDKLKDLAGCGDDAPSEVVLRRLYDKNKRAFDLSKFSYDQAVEYLVKNKVQDDAHSLIAREILDDSWITLSRALEDALRSKSIIEVLGMFSERLCCYLDESEFKTSYYTDLMEYLSYELDVMYERVSEACEDRSEVLKEEGFNFDIEEDVDFHDSTILGNRSLSIESAHGVDKTRALLHAYNILGCSRDVDTSDFPSSVKEHLKRLKDIISDYDSMSADEVKFLVDELKFIER